MLGQLIQRLTTQSVSSAPVEESSAGQESLAVQEDAIMQWRVVSADGASTLLDLDFVQGGQDLSQQDSSGHDPLEDVGGEDQTVPIADSIGNASTGKWNDATKNNLLASFAQDAPVIGSRRCPPKSPNIGMPSSVPRTAEILRAAATSDSIEMKGPSRPRTASLHPPEPQSDGLQACVREAVHGNSSSPVAGDGDAISRSLVADVAAAAPVRFRRASPMALLKTPAAGREIDGNLAKIITLWPNLTRPIKAAVLAMIDAASHET